jgi:AcrR family transcriptional regulator
MSRAEQTRAELLRVAHDLFTERGYAAVGTEEIVQRAHVTRGALYHHFRNKKDLFRAVHEAVERELTDAIAATLAGIEDPRELLLTGISSYLDACTEPSFMQIALLDAPAVLGWREWRETDERFGLGLVTLGLENAARAGLLPEQDVRAMGHLTLAALGEAAFLIAHADDRGAARREAERALRVLVRLEP